MDCLSRQNSSLIGPKIPAKFENDCISRNVHRFKITQPNLTILVSFSSAEDVLSNDVINYWHVWPARYWKSAVPLFLGHQVYMNYVKPIINHDMWSEYFSWLETYWEVTWVYVRRRRRPYRGTEGRPETSNRHSFTHTQIEDSAFLSPSVPCTLRIVVVQLKISVFGSLKVIEMNVYPFLIVRGLEVCRENSDSSDFCIVLVD